MWDNNRSGLQNLVDPDQHIINLVRRIREQNNVFKLPLRHMSAFLIGSRLSCMAYDSSLAVMVRVSAPAPGQKNLADDWG